MAEGLIRRGLTGLLAVLAIAACASRPDPAPEARLARDAEIVVFLVRHAEKGTGDDPGLTPAGQARARALARILAPEGVTEIWSTRTRRAEATAAPLAAMLGLDVQSYDTSTLPAFSRWLLDAPGVKLVVGHSNTTDTLAALLGADPGLPIGESEFDRLYVIEAENFSVTASRIERYGPRAGESVE